MHGYNTPGHGALTLRNLKLTGGRQRGGDSSNGGDGAGLGGAIYNQGMLRLDSVTLNDNGATGGSTSPGDDTIGSSMGGAVPLGTSDGGQDGNLATGTGGTSGGIDNGMAGAGGASGSPAVLVTAAAAASLPPRASAAARVAPTAVLAAAVAAWVVDLQPRRQSRYRQQKTDRRGHRRPLG